ncbi:hypothetical protein BGZ90_006195 [Linnemannia elongata]|nr:hypothetical protein BGZ90_006195 [Linnemannia elongata]
MEDQDPVCLGCHRSIEEGSVVAFGEGLWHVQCFRCAKCKNRVECDSNLLLLSDGSPICEQCSYNCNSCRRPILDEAIMTGDEAYHADCFRCIQCESKIEDLVFAKTSQGIYCMKCHQERKEAKRLREERERMARAERMMEKLLPTIPEAEKRTQDPFSTSTNSHSHSNSSTVNDIANNPISRDFPQRQAQLQHNQQQQQYHQLQLQQHLQQHQQQQHQHQHHIQHNSNVVDAPVADCSSPDMPRLPFHSLQPDKATPPKSNKVAPHSHGGHRSKADPALPSVDIGPPFLPPLIFGLDDASTSSFDIGDMLGGPESETSDKRGSSSDPPTPPAKDVEIISSLGINSFRASVSRASLRLSLPPKPLYDSVPVSETSRSSTDGHDTASLLKETTSTDHPSDSIPLHHQSSAEDDTMLLQEAEAMIQELRMELAKYNPMSPLLHGTTQQEYGLLMDKMRKQSQEHTDLEKTIRDMYIEKDMLGMDLEAMNNELKAKEEALESGTDKLQPATVQNPRLSTNHEFMKQAYLMEVKALQEQKDRLQRDIQLYVDQRDGVLNEMQILSVRNAELSTINNDMMREMQGRMDTKPTATPPNNGMLQSFTGKMRRQRQMSGGNQSDLRGGALLGSGESIHSFNSTYSDDQTRNRLASDPTILKARKEDMGDDNVEDGLTVPKKFNWKKGTTSTVKSVGAMFGKLLVEAPNSSLEVPNAKLGQSLSESGSTNSLLLPPTRTLSNNSETRSLNGRTSEQHAFVLNNFVRPIRCDACDDKLWGREYRCRNCAFHIHGRCMHDIIPGCTGVISRDSDSSSLRDITSSGGSSFGVPPPPPAKQIMFGNDLLDQLELEQRLVPLVVEKCIEAVDERGLEVEGIYRRSGMAAEARQLVQAYDIGMQPDLMDTEIYQDICSITSVLKQYLRSLPEPLIPYDLYAEFMEAISLPQNDAKIQTFKDLMDRMPVAHYATLKVLLEHLNRVTQKDKINLMNAKNLSVVFGPTLMRNPDPSREIMDMTFKNLTIEFFIVHTSELFAQDSPPSTNSSGGTNTERLSSSSNHERPSTSSSSTSASNGPPTSGRAGVNGTAHQPSPPPRRVPTNVAQAGSPPSSTSGQSSSLSSRSVAGDTAANLVLAPGQSSPHPQTSQPSQPLLPQPQPYQPVSQYRPQQHQTLQQLHQKQQQLQLQQKQQQQQEQQQEQQEQQQQQESIPPAPFSTSHNYIPTPQQQQANPEVDLTHFP